MSNSKKYQQCTACVMDTTDSDIRFDKNGVCNHCITFTEVTAKRWYPSEVGAQKLESIYTRIRKEGKGKDYDCILGLSGGVDSSYLALKIHEAKLRPLIIHVDGGWNCELAVQNIENIVKHCGWHLHTIVMDWEEMRDLQLAYLKSGVANQDVPQDHAFFSSLYNFSVKHGIRYILNGGNIATESILPRSWYWSAMDAINLRAIHKVFGTKKLKKFSPISFHRLYFYYPFIKRMVTIRPLNYMAYNKQFALQELKEKLGYKEYDGKHGESVFTKFLQNYWLPTRYGFDIRKPHLSSLIVSGQLTREAALQELAKPLYDEQSLADEKEYVAKKLGLTSEEFEMVLQMPLHNYRDFPNMEGRYTLLKKVQTIATGLLKRDLANYS